MCHSLYVKETESEVCETVHDRTLKCTSFRSEISSENALGREHVLYAIDLR